MGMYAANSYAAGSKQKVITDTVTRATADTFDGTGRYIGGCDDITFSENASAIAGGSTTSDTKIQHSHDNGLNDAWSDAPVPAFTQRTTAGGAATQTVVPTGPLKNYVRTRQVTTGGAVDVTSKVTMAYRRPHGAMPPSRAGIPSS